MCRSLPIKMIWMASSVLGRDGAKLKRKEITPEARTLSCCVHMLLYNNFMQNYCVVNVPSAETSQHEVEKVLYLLPLKKKNILPVNVSKYLPLNFRSCSLFPVFFKALNY